MKTSLFLLLFALSTGTANAAVMAKCSPVRSLQEVTGINLLLSNDAEAPSASAWLFLRSQSKERLEGNYTTRMEMESSYYGSDINKPAGRHSVKIVKSIVRNSDFVATVELRFYPNQSTTSVIGQLKLMTPNGESGANLGLVCDITDTLQE